MRRVHILAVAVGCAVLMLAACGGSPAGGIGSSGTSGGAGPSTVETNQAGDIPDNTAYVPFRGSSGRWEVSVPQGWARTSVGNAVVFTDKLNSVRLEDMPAATAPTVDSAKATEIPGIRSSGQGVSLGAVALVHRKGGDAVQIDYSLDSPPDSVTGKVVRDAVERYEFFHNGTELVVTLTGPAGADNVDPWRAVTDSVRWLS